MSPEQLLQELLDLAEAASLPVRRIRGGAGADGEPPASSATCRVQGETWVVLSAADPLEQRLSVLAGALRSQRPAHLEGRYLAPQLRELLESRGPQGKEGAAPPLDRRPPRE